MAYDAEKMRAALRSKMSGRVVDPDEFKLPKAQDGQVLRYKFFVLPPLNAGDKCKGGHASRDMDLFYVPDGKHWVNSRPHTCPRAVSGDSCAMCDSGFRLLKEAKAARASDTVCSEIRSSWLPDSTYKMNIYFPNLTSNPEEVRGRVMWVDAKKTIYTPMEEAMMRDDAGNDPQSPEAYGLFFDEQNAFLFQLEIVKKTGANYNDYSRSRFIVTDRTGAIATGPIVRTSTGQADQKAIQEVLDQRHDLWAKLGKSDPAAMRALASRLMNGDDYQEEEQQGGGFDQDETAAPRTAPTGARPSGMRQAAPSRPQRVVEDADADQATTHPSRPVPDLDDELPPAAPRTAPATTRPSSRPAPADTGPDDLNDGGDVEDDPELKALMGQLGDR